MAQTLRFLSRSIWPRIIIALTIGVTILAIKWINDASVQELCESHFTRAVSLTKQATFAGDKLLAAHSVVSEVVAGGEAFLDYCINHDLSISDQPENLLKLGQLAQVMPVEFVCAKNYEPVVQLIDLDQDSNDELILHTRALRCDSYGLDSGGLSIAFGKDEQTRQWHGTVIWPCFGEECKWADTWIQNTQPLVQRLNVRDSQGNSFLLVAGGYRGADANNEFLIVWRWDGTHATRALLLQIDDWCGWPIKWEVTEEGYIVIPATSDTSRCEGHSTEVYGLHGNTFALIK